MIYLDYSATTPVEQTVIDTFNKVTMEYIGNPNSTHALGRSARELMDASTISISKLLKVKPSEIIYTSCASEANNQIIKGIAYMYKNRGKHIITTPLEHSSIYGPLNYLQTEGFEVDFVTIDRTGKIDLNHLKNLMREDTILVSIGAVNSETGTKQEINKIADIVHESNTCFFHSDITQLIGKDKVDLHNIDLATISAHKFYGMKGIGLLIKKEKINLLPLIHGGKSTTVYRSGTPALALIASTAKALRLALENHKQRFAYVTEINELLKNELSKIDGVLVNTTDESIPHILNVSVPGIKPETFMRALEEHEIYISSQTACSSGAQISKAVYAITENEEAAASSLRISLSHLTSKKDIKLFIKNFIEIKNKLDL